MGIDIDHRVFGNMWGKALGSEHHWLTSPFHNLYAL